MMCTADIPLYIIQPMIVKVNADCFVGNVRVTPIITKIELYEYKKTSFEITAR